jgi:hypothetical protein
MQTVPSRFAIAYNKDQPGLINLCGNDIRVSKLLFGVNGRNSIREETILWHSKMTSRETKIAWLFLSSPLLSKLASILDADPSILYASLGPGNNRTRRIQKRIVKSIKNSFDDALVLLTEVCSNPAYLLKISSPVYYKGKTREQILTGSTIESMREVYFRLQRATIYDPATIDDLPFEALKKCLGYFVPRGRIALVASSLVSRAWRPAAQEHLRSLALTNKAKIESGLCGLLLRSIVLGSKSVSIANFKLDFRVDLVVKEFIPLIAQFVAPSLLTLDLSFQFMESRKSCFDILGTFFSQCPRIYNLSLGFFNFGDDPSNIIQSIMDGFYRLKDLRSFYSEGDVDMFMKYAPIRDLKKFIFATIRDWPVFMNTQTLTNMILICCFDSSDCLLKVVEGCPNLEILALRNVNGSLVLKRSDIEAIATLPVLELLDVNCEIEEGALRVSRLSFFAKLPPRMI